MENVIPVKAYMTRSLRRRAFAAFAMRDTNFSRWTREQLEAWLKEISEDACHTTVVVKDGQGGRC